MPVVLIFALVAAFTIWICLTHYLKDHPELKEKLHNITDIIVQKTMLAVWLFSTISGVLVAIDIFQIPYEREQEFFIYVMVMPCMLVVYVLQSWSADILWRYTRHSYSTNTKIITFSPLVILNFVQLYFTIIPTSGVIRLSVHVCIWAILGLLNMRRIHCEQ